MNNNGTRRYIVAALKVIIVAVTVFVVWMDAQGVVEKPVEQGPSKSQVAMEKAEKKCKTVPYGEFPTAHIIDWNAELPRFEDDDPGMTNYLFRVALGELDLNPEMAGFKLCK